MKKNYSIQEKLKKHKKAMLAGTAVCAAVLAVGFCVPVRIEVKQTGTLHQHTALTENDFIVQTSTLFGIKQKADGYKVTWDGWTEEQQAEVLGQYTIDDVDDESAESDTGLEEFARKKNRNIVTAEDILEAAENANEASPAEDVQDSKESSPSQDTEAAGEGGSAQDAANADRPAGEDASAENESEQGTAASDKDDAAAEASEKNTDAADAAEESPAKEAGTKKTDETLIMTGDTVTEYTISKGNLTDTVVVDAIPVTAIRADYDGKVYYADAPDLEKVKAYMEYEDGAKVDIDCTAEEVGVLTEAADIPVHTEYGDTVCHIEPVKVSSLSARYEGKVYSGDTADARNVRVTATFEDGHTAQTTASAFTSEAVVNDPGDFKVNSVYGETDVHIDPIPITGATYEAPGPLYEEDRLTVDKLTLVYEDGKTVVVSADDIELGAEALLPLSAGENEIPFIYKGKMYIFKVQVLHDTEIRRATMRYAEEIRTAEYSHLSDTIMVTVNRYTEANYTYLLTHIIIDDPSQIHAGLSNDDYGGARETPSSASERLGWVVGINGSNFDYATNTPTMADAKIKNGQVMPDSKVYANGMEICLTNGGNLFSPQAGMTVDDLLRMGVTDTWCCGDTLLISNGEAVNVGIQSLDYRYPRTAIGMVRPCEYYLITAGTTGYANGMTYDEIRDTLMNLDCGFGKCLDGGGSSTLIFENEVLNNPATGSERAVTDFLYFTE